MYEYRCTIVNVVDGDTVDALVDLGFHISLKRRFRLARINAPELRTDQGKISKEKLTSMLAGQLTVDTHKDRTEKYGRYLGTFYNSDGTDINQAMLDEGFAVPYLR